MTALASSKPEVDAVNIETLARNINTILGDSVKLFSCFDESNNGRNPFPTWLGEQLQDKIMVISFRRLDRIGGCVHWDGNTSLFVVIVATKKCRSKQFLLQHEQTSSLIILQRFDMLTRRVQCTVQAVRRNDLIIASKKLSGVHADLFTEYGTEPNSVADFFMICFNTSRTWSELSCSDCSLVLPHPYGTIVAPTSWIAGM